MKKFKSLFTKIGISIGAIFLTIYNYVLAVNINDIVDTQVLYGPPTYQPTNIFFEFIYLIIAIILGIIAIFNKKISKTAKLIISIIAILLLILFIVLMFI